MSLKQFYFTQSFRKDNISPFKKNPSYLSNVLDGTRNIVCSNKMISYYHIYMAQGT